MKTLVIECSSGNGSVAVLEGGQLVQERVFNNPRGRGGELFSVLEAIVRAHTDFTRVLVGTGPGSYNALRASIAAAWGIARARGIPLHGICSLLGYSPTDYDVIGDARAGQWFLGRIRGGSLAKPVELLRAQEVRELIDGSIPVFSTSDLLVSATTQYPAAASLALRLDQSGPAEPLYLKPPHITTPTK
jgi:tRNA threonylcarbamoyladenosine biosynthesis protein TsaB